MNKDPKAITIGVGKGESLPVRTQFLIFTLFGDYVAERGGKIWTSDLLYLMGLLGMSERAVRSTLSRMTRKKWIRSHKSGRLSQYSLSPVGQALLDAGRRRIFEPIYRDWDRQWHVVAYSLPEKKRRRRHTLRTQLSWLGFGSLAPGTWISPHARQDEINLLLSDLDVEAHVDLFCGVYLGPTSEQELVQKCWDLERLAAQYQEFIDHHEPAFLECLSRKERGEPLDPQDCFLRRFWLTHDFQSFPLRDPNLPTTLLSPDWIGFRARKMFDEYHRLLGTYAQQFVGDFINGN